MKLILIATHVNWTAMAATIGVNFLAVAAFLLYVKAFKTSGDFAFSPAYVLRLGINPWFIAGVALGMGAVVARMYIFSLIGAQRTYFMSAISYVLNSGIFVAVLREEMLPMQWAGVLFIALGVALVASE